VFTSSCSLDTVERIAIRLVVRTISDCNYLDNKRIIRRQLNMFNNLQWVLVLMTLASSIAVSKTEPNKYLIKVVESKALGSFAASQRLTKEKLEPKDVARIVSRVNQKGDKIADVSYKDLLEFNTFSESNCKLNYFRMTFLIGDRYPKEFLSYSNLKSYYDTCLDEYKARCIKSLSFIPEQERQELETIMKKLVETQKQCEEAEYTEPITCLEDFVTILDYHRAKNLGEKCESFLKSSKEAMETFSSDKETFVKVLKEKAPLLYLAEEHCKDLMRLIQRLPKP
jgi:hypothetical protein